MLKKIFFLIITIVLSTAVLANAAVEEDVLIKLFNTDDKEVSLFFAQPFLKEVSAEKITEILNSYRGKLGSLMNVKKNNNSLTMIFEHGTAPAKIVLNDEQKIMGLWFGSWTLNQDTVEKIISEFENLPSSVSVCVIKNNEEKIIKLKENQNMAVGSTFKLYVLKAVYDAAARDELAWDDVVILNKADSSLPSGILHDWPEGTPLTIKTLTNLMISISDNTATDKLIDILGRTKLENYVKKENIPFLKTNELFKLKYAVNEKIQQDYIEGNSETKRSILNKINNVIVNPDMLSGSPQLINELEWFITTQELCELIYELRDADEIKINPGLLNKENWHMVGYKGGSEPGVLQYTHLLQKEKGSAIYTVSVTANNSKNQINTEKITELTVRLISQINK